MVIFQLIAAITMHGSSQSLWVHFCDLEHQSQVMKHRFLGKGYQANEIDIGPILPDHAGVIYRGAPSMRGRVAPYVIDLPNKTKFFHNLKGYYPCCRCNVCHHNTCGRRKSEVLKSTTTNHTYQIKHFTTRHKVYLLTCSCKKQYVGRTVRPFSVRVNEHIANIKKSKAYHSVPKHCLQYHNKDPTGT